MGPGERQPRRPESRAAARAQGQLQHGPGSGVRVSASSAEVPRLTSGLGSLQSGSGKEGEQVLGPRDSPEGRRACGEELC